MKVKLPDGCKTKIKGITSTLNGGELIAHCDNGKCFYFDPIIAKTTVGDIIRFSGHRIYGKICI